MLCVIIPVKSKTPNLKYLIKYDGQCNSMNSTVVIIEAFLCDRILANELYPHPLKTVSSTKPTIIYSMNTKLKLMLLLNQSPL